MGRGDRDRDRENGKERNRDRRGRDRNRDRDQERERNRDRDQDRDRDRDRERRGKNDNDRAKRKGKSRSRSRSPKRRKHGSRSRSHERKSDSRHRSENDGKEPSEATSTVDKGNEPMHVERADELAYRTRVEQQLQEVEDSENSEDEEERETKEAEKRRARRKALLAKFKKDSPAATSKKLEPNKPSPSQARPGANAADYDENADDAEEKLKMKQLNMQTGKKKEESAVTAVDMFVDSPSKLLAEKGLKLAVPGQMVDDSADHEGYYKFRLGDLMNNRYQVTKVQGKGVFSTVLRVKDTLSSDRDLVVKILRNNEVMQKAGLKELEFLQHLAAKDPENKKHCVKLETHFEHKEHLCLVFEPLALNLRELLKKFGTGLSIKGVKSYAKQLFTSLKHVKKCGILHGDIKLDNILVNEKMNVLKLCDFGSASWIKECVITPYLVSRFYRAPEIMMGMEYDAAADMFSVGCVLFELFTGKILFPGKNNNEMLRMIMEVSGGYSKKLIKRGQFSSKYFDDRGQFKLMRIDPLTKQELTKFTVFDRPTRDLYSMLMEFSSPTLKDDDKFKISQLGDLLSKCLCLDHHRRISVEQALQHPFVAEA